MKTFFVSMIVLGVSVLNINAAEAKPKQNQKQDQPQLQTRAQAAEAEKDRDQNKGENKKVCVHNINGADKRAQCIGRNAFFNARRDAKQRDKNFPFELVGGKEIECQNVKDAQFCEKANDDIRNEIAIGEQFPTPPPAPVQEPVKEPVTAEPVVVAQPGEVVKEPIKCDPTADRTCQSRVDASKLSLVQDASIAR